jgi:hypothetical protein
MRLPRSFSPPVVAACALLVLVMLLPSMPSRGSGKPPAYSSAIARPAADTAASEVQPVEAPAPVSEARCRNLTRRRHHPGLQGGPFVQFIHVPKAGGSSVQDALRAWCKANERCSCLTFNGPLVEGSAARCPPNLAGWTMFAGHRGYGFCRVIERSPRGLVTLVALREPVSRIRSLYDYEAHRLQRNSVAGHVHKLAQLVVRYNSTEKVEAGEARLKFMGMQQTRFLCGYRCFESPDGNSSSSAFSSEGLRALAGAMLGKAKQNLARVDAVAVLSRLNDLVPQLRFHLGSTLTPRSFQHWPHDNVLPEDQKSLLTKRAEDILRSWSWADQELYEFAQRIAKAKTTEAKTCLKRMSE